MGNSDRLSLLMDNRYEQSINIAISLSVIDGHIPSVIFQNVGKTDNE